MTAWDTVLGQRTLESINSMAHDISKIKDNNPTLRDYFAAQFMNGWCHHISLESEFSQVADAAYKMADAMIEARKSTTNS